MLKQSSEWFPCNTIRSAVNILSDYECWCTPTEVLMDDNTVHETPLPTP